MSNLFYLLFIPYIFGSINVTALKKPDLTMTFLVLDVKSDPNDAFEGNIKKAKKKNKKTITYLQSVAVEEFGKQ